MTKQVGLLERWGILGSARAPNPPPSSFLTHFLHAWMIPATFLILIL